MKKDNPKTKSTFTHKNSHNSLLASLKLGERVYIETTLEDYGNQMSRINSPKSRRPEELKDKEFTCTLFTAVASASNIRYLICLERVK